MVGLGPHEMSAWLWVFSVGLAVGLTGLSALSIYIAVRATDIREGRKAGRRFYPYPVGVVGADAKRRVWVDERNSLP